MDIRIFKRADPTATDETQLTFGFVKGTGTVSGMEALIQLVIVNLFTDFQTDPLTPKRGGGLMGALRTIGKNKDPKKLAAVIQAAIRKTESDILTQQAIYSLPATERLGSLKLKNVSPPVAGSISVSMEIKNDTGEAEVITL